jgi:hypothetical protein
MGLGLQDPQRSGETMSEPAKNVRVQVLATAAHNCGTIQAKAPMTYLMNEVSVKVGYLRFPIR